MSALQARPAHAAAGLPLPGLDETNAPAMSPAERTGFDIGSDHARHGLTPPADHLHAGHPVRLGWDAGRLAFAGRTLRPTVHVRRWLQLRLAAWLRGQPVDALQCIPALLRRLAVDVCPVTGLRLSQDTGLDSDAVIVTLRSDAALSPGHLVMASRRAAQALQQVGHRLPDALALARALDEAEPGDQRHGLDAQAWWKLAVLLSLVTPLPQAQAATLPLRAWPTPRLRVLNPVQSLQVVLTRAFTDPEHPAPVQALAALMPAAVRADFHVFMHTLLSRRVAVARGDAAQLQRALLVAWSEPLVQRRWTRLALGLTAAECEAIVEIALSRGLVRGGLRTLPAATATEGWAVDIATDALPAAAGTPTWTERRRLPRPAERSAWPAASRQRALPLS